MLSIRHTSGLIDPGLRFICAETLAGDETSRSRPSSQRSVVEKAYGQMLRKEWLWEHLPQAVEAAACRLQAVPEEEAFSPLSERVESSGQLARTPVDRNRTPFRHWNRWYSMLVARRQLCVDPRPRSNQSHTMYLAARQRIHNDVLPRNHVIPLWLECWAFRNA